LTLGFISAVQVVILLYTAPSGTLQWRRTRNRNFKPRPYVTPRRADCKKENRIKGALDDRSGIWPTNTLTPFAMIRWENR